MNKKARQMILYYLKNLINSEYEIIPSLFIYNLKKYSSYLFGFDLDLLFKSNDNNINNDINREFIFNLINGKLHRNNALFKEKGLYKRISDAFNSQKSDYNIDITHPDFDKNFTLICDTFDLQRIVEYYYCF